MSTGDSKDRVGRKRLLKNPLWEIRNARPAFEAIRKESNKIRERPEVIGIGFGPKRGVDEGLAVPTVHVFVKWMSMKDAAKLKLPSKIAGYEVEVIPMRVSGAGCNGMDNTWYGWLKPGRNIGPTTGCGTLGMKVYNRYWVGNTNLPLSSQPTYILTAYHVCPWVTSEIYQPGAPTAAQVGDPNNIIGKVVKTIGWADPRSSGLFEVSLIKLETDRNLNNWDENDRPIFDSYPTGEPAFFERLDWESASRMNIGGMETYHGYGYAVDIVDVTINFPPEVDMKYQLLVAAERTDDILSHRGASGSVLYNANGTPVAIAAGSGQWNVGGDVYDIVLASFLKSAIGPDVLEELNVSNIPPSPGEIPPNW